jgi:hypothetical protein
MVGSAQSSAEEGGTDWDNNNEGLDVEAVNPGKSKGCAAEHEEEEGEVEEEEEEEEEGAEGEAEDAERCQPEMDELLAIQTTSLEQYNKI